MKPILVAPIFLTVWFLLTGWVEAASGIFAASPSSISQKRGWGLPRTEKKTSLMSSSVPNRTGENDQEQDEEIMDDMVVQPAFFRPLSQLELVQMQATSPAIACARHRRSSPTSELELLESSLLPCSRKMYGLL